MTTGWAIKDGQDGPIIVATVSPTRRGALVNWLVACARVPILQRHSDGLIETIWLKHSKDETRARAVMVRIEEIAS